MATIEPRLIHLLNGSSTPPLGHADLPPAAPTPASTTGAVTTTTATTTTTTTNTPTPTTTASTDAFPCTSVLAAIARDRELFASSPISLSMPPSSNSSSYVDTLALPALQCDGGGPRLGTILNAGGLVPAPYALYHEDPQVLVSVNNLRIHPIGNPSNPWRPPMWSEPSRVVRVSTPLPPPLPPPPPLSLPPPPPLPPAADHPFDHFRQVLEDYSPELVADDGTTAKKRPAVSINDDAVPLPQPVKKHKALAPQQGVPPIINGLHEPPHHESLLPPISDGITLIRSLIEFNSSQPDAHITPSLSHTLVPVQPQTPAQVHVHVQAHSRTQAKPEPEPEAKGQVQAQTQMEAEARPPVPSEHPQPVEPERLAPAAAKPRRRSSKPRRKWTEEETRQLLLGVSRHGVGKWTVILDDADFSFNDRSAGDLKDRFRTCCPAELRRTNSTRSSGSPPALCSKTKTLGLMSENLLHDDMPVTHEITCTLATATTVTHAHGQPEQILDSPATSPQSAVFPATESSAAPATPAAGQRKSRAHRKQLADLAEMGIHAPFKPSRRRERRPFTDEEDRNILDGLEIYGAAWTKIQRDPRFGLSSRQPTDLRDRVRNKYPDVYWRVESLRIASQTR